MSFLSDIGKAGFAGLRFAAPLLGGLASGYVPDPLHTISGLVLTAESLGEHCLQSGGSKIDKLSLVTDAAEEVFLASPLFKGKRVTNQDSFRAGVTQVVQGIVQVLQSIDSVTKPPQPPPAPKPATPPAG